MFRLHPLSRTSSVASYDVPRARATPESQKQPLSSASFAPSQQLSRSKGLVEDKTPEQRPETRCTDSTQVSVVGWARAPLARTHAMANAIAAAIVARPFALVISTSPIISSSNLLLPGSAASLRVRLRFAFAFYP